jgi:hypothetical protein
LHPFLPNQFYRIIFLIIISSGLGCIPARALSEENPGIIESFERLLEVHKKQYEQNKNKIESNVKAISDIGSIDEIRLDSQFVRSLIFHSDDKFLRLAQSDDCKFLSVLENNLLRTADGEVTNILISYKGTGNILENAAIPRNDFFGQIYKKKCLSNKEFSVLFNENNFQKTIEGIKFTAPKNESACQAIHKEWLDNQFTPYLCGINQIIKKSKISQQVEKYKAKIPAMQRIYIENLCNNITSSANFCENYLKKDVWNNVINGEAPIYKMSFKCQNIMGKTSELTINDLKNCGAKLNAQPATCETKGTKDHPADFPLQNCDNISEALRKSKLVTNYHDCPANVDNEALTNIHRMVNHFVPRSLNSDKDNCGGEASYTFAKLNMDINHESGWPLKICYMNRVSQKEVCTPYIPGSREKEPLSEDQVIAKILYQQKGASPKTKCRIVDSKIYNPLRSDFKFGCFIVYDSETCTTLSCEKKVIWEEKTLTDIKFIGRPIFDYFPTAFVNERYSFENMMNELNGTQTRTIKNLTDFKFYLDTIQTGIIHGIGCIEDLIPEEFQRTAINQCHPIPFITDGYILKNNETWIILRSAIDDLHTPRLISWHNIFNSVSSYRELHPLNTWTLYGIKK